MLIGCAEWSPTCVTTQVFDGWVMKRQTFPGNGDYPLPAERRSRDFCRGLGSLQRTFSSSQNVAMILFNIATPGQGFTVAVRKALSHARTFAPKAIADVSLDSTRGYGPSVAGIVVQKKPNALTNYLIRGKKTPYNVVPFWQTN